MYVFDSESALRASGAVTGHNASRWTPGSNDGQSDGRGLLRDYEEKDFSTHNLTEFR